MKANEAFEQLREQWVQETVVPALEGTALLAGCPDDFLYDVAACLVEKTYKDGQTICVCGEPGDSMLMILEGTAEIEAKSGAKISHFREGACFGEVAALGIFQYRTATVRAVGKVRVLSVTQKALDRAIEKSDEDMVRMAFARLTESRREQVQKGMPMCALPINAKPEDVCVRAVALQAERIDLAPGQCWEPLSDFDACGAHFGVITKGRALLETVEERRLVTSMKAGELFPEGMAAEYNTNLRAVTALQGYRVRQTDFLVAVYSMPSAQEWFYRFRLLDKRTRAHLHSRLNAVRGVTEGVRHCQGDDDIHHYRCRKLKALERAKTIKVETAQLPAKLPLMANVPAHRFLESPIGRSFRVDTRIKEADRAPLTRVASAPALVNGDCLSLGGMMSDVAKDVHLPRLQTAS
jgi:CRP-like cAMP-binding protein